MTDEKLYELYVTKGWSIRKINENYGGNRQSYSRRLKEMGAIITGNNPGQQRRYTFGVDEDFFKRETDEKYYVLGFFFADGSFLENGIKFDQTIRDREILDKIRIAMKAEHEVKIYEGRKSYAIIDGDKREYDSAEMCRLAITRASFKEELLDFGFSLDKTYSESDLDIPAPFIGSFLRGFFDGDGSINTGHTNVVSFTIKNQSNAEFIFQLLNQVEVNPKMLYSSGKDIYTVRVTTLYDLEELYNLFYNNVESLFLERKKKAFPSY